MDNSESEQSVPVPQWHHDTLRAREQAIKEGQTTFSTWSDAKKRLRRKQLTRLLKTVEDNHEQVEKAWNEHFS